MAIARNKNFLLLKNGEDLFLNEEDPHLVQTILPPKEPRAAPMVEVINNKGEHRNTPIFINEEALISLTA